MPSTHAAKRALDVVPPSLAGEYDQQRLDRLRELRAVIDTLRSDQEMRDPLLAWVVQHGKTPQP
jgi:hypothetical protein